MDRIITTLLRARNRHILACDLIFFLITPTLALALRVDGIIDPETYLSSLLIVTACFTLIKLAIFFLGDLYGRYWRYASIEELSHITVLGLLATIMQTLVFFLVLRNFGWVSDDFPRSVPIIEGILATAIAGAIRYSVPLVERRYHRRNGKGHGESVVIVGAGSAGVMVAQEMHNNPHLGLRPVAFVDDAPDKRGARIRGIPVLGGCKDIPQVCRETNARQVLIAMSSARGKVIREIVTTCERAGVQTKIIPGMYELLGGTVSVTQIRDVQIEDLLGREPIETDVAAVAELIRGKRILVTGGGGSIGSELCRQVLRFHPRTLVILGHGENSVFDIHNELERTRRRGLWGTEQNGELPTEIASVIADIRSPERIHAALNEHRPDIVFHSAAHKHVPLMEMNPSEAITNNVIGTRILLDACEEHGVEHFVMISTDKAVNPTSVMGASKRVTELLVHQAAQRTGRKYVAVRFGNVLGSRGSVVHTFKQQIAAGGPVTITHAEMKRYFMTIPEAVQLVLQSSALGQGGEVFMLDMGEPVKIVELARDLIELCGLQVGVDVDIEYTGLRPGEKLFEEMFVDGEDYERTQHEKIFIAANASSFVPTWLDKGVGDLEQAAHIDSLIDMLVGLKVLVPEFQPQGHTLDDIGFGQHTGPLKPLETDRTYKGIRLPLAVEPPRGV